MKTLFLGIVTMSLVSCIAGSKSEEKNVDSQEVDSVVAVAETTDVEEAAPAAPTFRSADLKKFGLLGKVKSVSAPKDSGDEDMSISEGFISEVISFNEAGVKTSPKKFSDLDLTFGQDGFIRKMYTDFGATDGSSTTITVTETNQLGWPVKGKVDTDIAGIMMGSGNLSFSYPDVDSKGNWTKQLVKVVFDYEEVETGDVMKWEGTITRTRTITYY